MTPFRSVIRKSFGSCTADPNAVAHFPVVGAKKSTQSAGTMTITASTAKPSDAKQSYARSERPSATAAEPAHADGLAHAGAASR